MERSKYYYIILYCIILYIFKLGVKGRAVTTVSRVKDKYSLRDKYRQKSSFILEFILEEEINNKQNK